MLSYILRRIGASALVLFVGSFLLYVLVINSGDPLEELRESRDPNRENIIAATTLNMGLDLPWYERYWGWLSGALNCVRLECDFGTMRSGQEILPQLATAAGSTLRLVFLATLLAIIFGVTLGVLSAIRKYSVLDYSVTLFAFVFFSMPVFWAAVFLKDWGAIRFNNWIADPSVDRPTMIGIAIAAAVLAGIAFGGTLRRTLIGAGTGFLTAIVALSYFNVSGFYLEPRLGIVLMIAIGVGGALVMTIVTSGLRYRRVLYSGLATVAVGAIAYLVLFDWISEGLRSYWMLMLLGLVSIGVGVAIGAVVGGWNRRSAMLASGGTAAVFAVAALADQLFRNWPGLLDKKGRPIRTLGSETSRLDGTFWESVLDQGTQLLLPTILLTIISLAAYSRYTRSSMLEVLGQDYVRTARAKGLSERTVISRHAFRNALIPLCTIVAFDFASLIGGAVVTETVFGWSGMGALFRTGLDQTDPVPVMAFYIVTGTAAILMNLAADLLYAVLDPRITT